MWSRTRNLLIFLTLPWLLVACAGLPALPTFGRSSQPADPLVVYRQAMAPSQRGLLDDLPPLPDYRMEVQVDPAAPLLTGRLTVTIPPEPDGSLLPEYYFRLYPNLNYYGGSMSVTLATVNGMGAPFDYRANDTAVRVVVPPNATQPGEAVTIGLQWRLRPPVWDDERYHLIGASGGVLALPAFYPMLAVRDPDAPDGWRLDISMLQGDLAYSPAATYQVTATVPANYVVAATGSTLAVQDVPTPTPEGDKPTVQPAWKSWRLVSGPARRVRHVHQRPVWPGRDLRQRRARQLLVSPGRRGDRPRDRPNTPPPRCASTTSCLAPIPTPSWIWSPARWSSAAWSTPG